MFLPDVNVLIYAFRPDTAEHHRCKAWLDYHAHTDGALALSNLTLSAVVRITTTKRFFVTESTVESAFAFCNELREMDTVELIEPGRRHWSIFQSLCMESGVRGPKISDVWLAALAIEWGCEFVTMDRDFARFPGLRWRRPE